MAEFGTEAESSSRLTRVDRQAVRGLIIIPRIDFIREISSKFYEKQKPLKALVEFGYLNLDKDSQNDLDVAVGISGELLARSQPRTGGIIPEEVSDDTINSFRVSKERAKTASAFSSIQEKLFNSDPELFFGLTVLADKMKRPPGNLLEGGYILIQIYNHILGGRKLENNLNSHHQQK